MSSWRTWTRDGAATSRIRRAAARKKNSKSRSALLAKF
jgi:hypothetical protein